MYTEAIGVQMYNGDRIPFADLKARTETENEYDPNSTYALGEACTHEGKTYVANTAISTAEAWNSAHWDESNIVTLYNEVKSNLVKYLKINNVITFASGSTGSGYKTYSFSDDDACKGKTILSVHAITSSVSGSATMMTDDRYFDSNTYGMVYSISSALPGEVKYSLVVAYI